MAKKLTSVKSIIYLSVLSVVLIFSLYSLFSDDAKSWFVINKKNHCQPDLRQGH